MPEVGTYSCNDSVGEVKTMDSWQSLASQPILTNTLQKREKLSQKTTEMDSILTLISGLLMPI